MTDGDLNAALLISYLNFDFTHILKIFGRLFPDFFFYPYILTASNNKGAKQSWNYVTGPVELLNNEEEIKKQEAVNHLRCSYMTL